MGETPARNGCLETLMIISTPSKGTQSRRKFMYAFTLEEKAAGKKKRNKKRRRCKKESKPMIPTPKRPNRKPQTRREHPNPGSKKAME